VRNRTVRFSAVLSIYGSKMHIPTMPATVPSPLHQGFDYSQFVYSLENFLTEGGSAVQLPGGAR
jgi:hypothetical protein